MLPPTSSSSSSSSASTSVSSASASPDSTSALTIDDLTSYWTSTLTVQSHAERELTAFLNSTLPSHPSSSFGKAHPSPSLSSASGAGWGRAPPTSPTSMGLGLVHSPHAQMHPSYQSFGAPANTPMGTPLWSQHESQVVGMEMEMEREMDDGCEQRERERQRQEQLARAAYPSPSPTPSPPAGAGLGLGVGASGSGSAVFRRR